MGKYITVFENRCDEPFRQFSDGCCGALRTIDSGGDKYILELDELKKDEQELSNFRFYKQAYETLINSNCKPGDIIQPFNKIVIKSGICPTLTTRPEGFKTAIIVVVK